MPKIIAMVVMAAAMAVTDGSVTVVMATATLTRVTAVTAAAAIAAPAATGTGRSPASYNLGSTGSLSVANTPVDETMPDSDDDRLSTIGG